MTRLIAHRGGALVAPENTVFAFEQAVRRFGADMIETDVHLTADGEVVVIHDPTLDRTTDAGGEIARLTLAEVRRADAGHRLSLDGGATFPFRGQGLRVPTLAEALDALPDVPFNIDLKANSLPLVDAVARVLRDRDAARRCILGSEDDALGRAIHAAVPEARHFYPVNALIAYVQAVKMGLPRPAERDFTVFDVPAAWQGMEVVDEAFVAAAHADGKVVQVWDVETRPLMHRLVGLGVDGIMTDRPDWLREVLGERRR